MLSELTMFRRYVGALETFLGDSVTVEEARSRVEREFALREESLIELLAAGVWARSESPYRKLLVWAGVEQPELEAMIRAEGVDRSLETLYRAGVHATIEEVKGKRPIVRNGLEIQTRHEDFDSPLLNPHFEGRSGGSGGAPRRFLLDLSLVTTDAIAHLLFVASFDLIDQPMALWRPLPPANSGIRKLMMQALHGATVERWFCPFPPRWVPRELKYTLFTQYTVRRARARGHRFPFPEHVPLDRPEVVAGWMAEQVAAGRRPLLDAPAGATLRVCEAARARGLDLSGSTFRTGGEALTPERARMIEAVGGRPCTHLSMSEVGTVASACGDPHAPDDTHLLQNKLAAVFVPDERAGADDARALLLTTLFGSCPKILLNVETGDSARVVRRRCHCLHGATGSDLHLHHIRSYEKLTAEGMHFLPEDLIRLVDVVLPSTFGGSPSDYQLVQERRNGLTRVDIVVAPEVGAVDEARVIEVTLSALSRGSAGNRFMSAYLREADAFRVVRVAPFATGAGKIPPLHVAHG